MPDKYKFFKNRKFKIQKDSLIDIESNMVYRLKN